MSIDSYSARCLVFMKEFEKDILEKCVAPYLYTVFAKLWLDYDHDDFRVQLHGLLLDPSSSEGHNVLFYRTYFWGSDSVETKGDKEAMIANLRNIFPYSDPADVEVRLRKIGLID